MGDAEYDVWIVRYQYGTQDDVMIGTLETVAALASSVVSEWVSSGIREAIASIERVGRLASDQRYKLSLAGVTFVGGDS